MDENINTGFSNFEDDYDRHIQQEIEVRRMRRKQIAKHRVKITRCNILIAGEVATLLVLFIALALLTIGK